jgi:hypothetical protein
LDNDIVVVRLPILILPQPNHQRLANALGVVSRVKASGSCNEVLRRRWRAADLVRDRLDLGAIWRVESKVISTIILCVAPTHLCSDSVSRVWLNSGLELLLDVSRVEEEDIHTDSHIVLVLVEQTLAAARVCGAARHGNRFR